MAQHTKSRYQVSPLKEQENEVNPTFLQRLKKVSQVIFQPSTVHIIKFLIFYLCLYLFICAGSFKFTSIIAAIAVLAAGLIFGPPIIKRYNLSTNSWNRIPPKSLISYVYHCAQALP